MKPILSDIKVPDKHSDWWCRILYLNEGRIKEKGENTGERLLQATE